MVAAPVVPSPPEEATELIHCSEARLLRDLGLLRVDPAELREDAPLTQFRKGSAPLWTRWTPSGADASTTWGSIEPSREQPLFAHIDDAPGCWFWSAEPEGLLHLAPEGAIRAWPAKDALAEGLMIDAAALRSVVVDTLPAPATTWQPEGLSRYSTERLPLPPKDPKAGGLNPLEVTRMLLGSCPEWRPGITIAVAGSTLALLCPVDDKPRKALRAYQERVEAEGFEVTSDGGVLTVSGGFVLFSHVTATPGALALSNSPELARELSTPSGGTPWWGDELPRSGVWTRTPQATLHTAVEGEEIVARGTVHDPKGLTTLFGARSGIDVLVPPHLLTSPGITLAFEGDDAFVQTEEVLEERVVGGVIGGSAHREASRPSPQEPSVYERVMPPSWPVAGTCVATFHLYARGGIESVDIGGDTCPEGYPERARPRLMQWGISPRVDATGTFVPATFEVTIRIEATP